MLGDTHLGTGSEESGLLNGNGRDDTSVVAELGIIHGLELLVKLLDGSIENEVATVGGVHGLSRHGGDGVAFDQRLQVEGGSEGSEEYRGDEGNEKHGC